MYKNRSNYARDGFRHSGFPQHADEYGFKEVNGRMVLAKTGEKNVYQMIQEAIPQTSLTAIINRLMKGDKSAIGDVVANFVDATKVPKNLMEAQNLMIYGERYFETLPTDVRNKYQNDLSAFFADVDRALLARQQSPAPVEEPKTEVKE